MKEKLINYSNSTIHYKITGAGLPVVLIHGFAEDSRIWDNQVAFLKNDYNLIIPDLPGSGGSAPLSEGEGLGVRSIEDYAECIKQILDAEKISRCIMIGHSMGGYITLAFAEKFPEALISFGLFHSSAYADDAAKVETRKKAIAFIEKNGASAFLQTSIPGLFYDQGNSEQPDALIEGAPSSRQATEVARRPERIAELLERGKAFSPKTLIQYYEAMIARPDRTEVLIKAPCPVLFILGEHDKAVPFKQGLEQSHLPDQSYVYILRDSAHMGMLEESGKANQILAYFLLNQQCNN